MLWYVVGHGHNPDREYDQPVSINFFNKYLYLCMDMYECVHICKVEAFLATSSTKNSTENITD